MPRGTQKFTRAQQWRRKRPGWRIKAQQWPRDVRPTGWPSSSGKTIRPRGTTTKGNVLVAHVRACNPQKYIYIYIRARFVFHQGRARPKEIAVASLPAFAKRKENATRCFSLFRQGKRIGTWRRLLPRWRTTLCLFLRERSRGTRRESLV